MPIPTTEETSPSDGAATPRRIAVAHSPPSAHELVPGEAPLASVRAAALAKLEPTPPFLLRHHYKCWEVGSVEGIEGTFWLPLVDVQFISPGVNGMRTLGRNEVGRPENAYENAVRIAVKNGWTYLWPEDFPEFGRSGYLRRIECRLPGTAAVAGHFHCDPFTRILANPDDREYDHVRYDHEAFRTWRFGLVATGKIAPPSEQVRHQLLRRAARRVERNEANIQIPDAVRNKLVARRTAEAEAVAHATVPVAA